VRSRFSGEERGVLISGRQAELCSDVLGGGERFERHKVEANAVVDESRHGPCELAEREELDRVRQADEGLNRCDR